MGGLRKLGIWRMIINESTFHSKKNKKDFSCTMTRFVMVAVL
jgi:hypothetical protein